MLHIDDRPWIDELKVHRQRSPERRETAAASHRCLPWDKLTFRVHNGAQPRIRVGLKQKQEEDNPSGPNEE